MTIRQGELKIDYNHSELFKESESGESVRDNGECLVCFRLETKGYFALIWRKSLIDRRRVLF